MTIEQLYNNKKNHYINVAGASGFSPKFNSYLNAAGSRVAPRVPPFANADGNASDVSAKIEELKTKLVELQPLIDAKQAHIDELQAILAIKLQTSRDPENDPFIKLTRSEIADTKKAQQELIDKRTELNNQLNALQTQYQLLTQGDGSGGGGFAAGLGTGTIENPHKKNIDTTNTDAIITGEATGIGAMVSKAKPFLLAAAAIGLIIFVGRRIVH